MMLNPPGIGVPDRPAGVFKFGLGDITRLARVFEPYISKGFTDAEAWAALLADEEHLRIVRLVHGNRPTKAPRGRWSARPRPLPFTAERTGS